MLSIGQQSLKAWSDDECSMRAAALAYYALFSIAPLLLIIVSVAGLAFGEAAVQGLVVTQLRQVVGQSVAEGIEAMLIGVSQPRGGLVAMAIGLALMAIGATTVVSELQRSLDVIWRAPRSTRGMVAGLLRSRVTSLAVIVATAVLLTLSLLLDAALAAVRTRAPSWLDGWADIAGWANKALAFLLLTTVIVVVYKALPRVRIAWQDVLAGALVTALLLALGRTLIGLYVSHADVGSGYGAAGALVVALVWAYYSASIFLLGAEFTWAWAHTVGSRHHTPPPAMPTATATAS